MYGNCGISNVIRTMEICLMAMTGKSTTNDDLQLRLHGQDQGTCR